MRSLLFIGVVFSALGAAAGSLDWDLGADLRIRQELMLNVPGLPGGGRLSRAVRGEFANQMRFRPRAWGELRFDGGETAGKWRLKLRLTDEFRWNPEPHKSATTWPGELIIDNLFLEGKGLFDGFLDLSVGRQDLYNLYGLDHVFVDGTPGDGSRTTFADMVRLALNFTPESKLDLFFLHDADDNVLRWGTERSKHRSLSGIDPSASPDMDDWGYGAIWSSRYDDWLGYQLFAIEKLTDAYRDGAGVKHPDTRRTLFGVKLVPRITNELSLDLEGMAQVGRNGDGERLSGWSAYAGGQWKSAREGWRPFAKIGLHFMSGDRHAADEDGGHDAWDPMWSRGVNDSEIFLSGTHYGVGWWSNMIFLKTELGVEFSRSHSFVFNTGPMFAAARDGMGGGDGAFKGELSQVRYDFPILLADRAQGERFEMVGHLYFELFNPGDYFETGKPSWFARWQIDFRF